MTKNQKGISLVIVCGVLYGLVGYFGKTIINQGFSSYNMLFWRFFVATCFTAIFATASLIEKDFFKKNLQDIQKISFFSAVFHTTAACLLFATMARISAGLAVVLFFSYPIVVMILNFLIYKTRIGKLEIAILSMMLGGVFLIADMQNFNLNFSGILYGISAAFFYGCYIFSLQKTATKPTISVFFIALSCTIYLAIISLIDGSFQLPQNFDSIINIIIFGTICAAIPMLLLIKSLKYISTQKAAILGVCEPISALIFGFVLLGENINYVQLVGVIFVVIAATLASLKK